MRDVLLFISVVLSIRHYAARVEQYLIPGTKQRLVNIPREKKEIRKGPQKRKP